ncbi:hypothetical protein EHEL_070150 [Encephalitozoon hellem ATCC 50504]|uniref:DUF5088 domain-containing protein n=1 Tax=Encephalitozoon hellem TaxID=27973 RepID=A0A9Q9C3J2_ENCHE|nr:uncharacterized protein EHEL_070150 [Encephalitozoon hellem ATCC 50504]AFM98543.1 hypothetical protein EHEL_070150 [Encephalitozoon hellem ATCC 50504]UTX43486.1 DUF5088 domain-containing protein [Encephalitozoon hellem]|eukprot:XP_003887524.1 hypothetical protein EHEL_070150 [Encephalitozoon hellem ATCC 50504]
MEEYEILEIYREISLKGIYDFKMFLFDGKKISVKKVSGKMRARVRKGMCYKHDWIRVQEEEDGIVFEVTDPKTYSYLSIYGREFDSNVYLTVRGNADTTCLDAGEGTTPDPNSNPGECYPCEVPKEFSERILLPFLNDTLPYSPLEIPMAKDDDILSSKDKHGELSPADSPRATSKSGWYNRSTQKSPICGRVIYKTRMSSVTYARKHPYYFFILLTSALDSIKVFVWGEDLPYSSMKIGDYICLTKCRKKPIIEGPLVVEHNRFTEARYFCCKEVSAKEMFKIKLDRCQEMPASIFAEALGKIEYLSVLNRRNAGYLEEYYLVRMGKYKVLLFYNSSKEFYEMEVGKYVRITNLRVSRRGRSEFYVSTIYTQIELKDMAEDPSKRKLSDDEADAKRRSRMAINFEESEDEDDFLEKKEEEPPKCNLIFGAVGYIPDDFLSIEEMYLSRKEKISGEMCEIIPFMAPLEINLRDIYNEVEKLVLNESKKYMVDAILVDVDFSNFIFDESPTLMDGTSVTYFSNGVQAQQLPGYISICNEVTVVVYLFNNFWMDEFDLESLYKLGGCSSLEEFRSMRGKGMRFVIDAFRASEETVMFYLTKVFR